MNTLSQSIELPYILEFLATLNSSHTRQAYLGDIRSFEAFLNQNALGLEALKPEYIGVFRESLRGSKSLNSINRVMACLKSYFKFLIIRDVLTRNPTDVIKSYPSPEYTETPALTDDETVRMLESVNRKTDVGLRDYAILTLMFYLGPRNAEVRSLTIGSIQRDGDLNVLNIHGKGNKVRTLPLPDAVNTALQEYFHARILPRGENSR